MKKITLIILLINLSLSPLNADNVDDCVNFCSNLFDKYISKFSEKEKRIWNEKRYDMLEEIQKEFDTANKNKKYYTDAGLAATQFLNRTGLRKMKLWTQLVNEMGENYYKQQLHQSTYINYINKLEKIFEEYRNTENASIFYDDREKFISLKNQSSDTTNVANVASFVYKEHSSVWDNDPKIHTFKVNNWLAKIEELHHIENELKNIASTVENKEYIVVKDKNPLLPFALCILTIIVTIPSYLETYYFKYSKRIFYIATIISIIICLLLIYNNPSTLINMIVSVIFPAIMFIIFYRKGINKKRDSQNQEISSTNNN